MAAGHSVADVVLKGVRKNVVQRLGLRRRPQDKIRGKHFPATPVVQQTCADTARYEVARHETLVEILDQAVYRGTQSGRLCIFLATHEKRRSAS